MGFSNLRQVINNRDDVYHSRFSSVLPSRSMCGQYLDLATTAYFQNHFSIQRSCSANSVYYWQNHKNLQNKPVRRLVQQLKLYSVHVLAGLPATLTRVPCFLSQCECCGYQHENWKRPSHSELAAGHSRVPCDLKQAHLHNSTVVNWRTNLFNPTVSSELMPNRLHTDGLDSIPTVVSMPRPFLMSN